MSKDYVRDILRKGDKCLVTLTRIESGSSVDMGGSPVYSREDKKKLFEVTTDVVVR